MNRRDLLKWTLLGAAHPLLPVRGLVSQAFAAPGAADVRFLLVFLRGGYDSASVLVPIGSASYYELRPTIAIPKPDANNPSAAISLAGRDDEARWGLHPALTDSMLPLWRKGELAFIPFAGTPDLTRSHFETQDSVEGGMPVAAASASSSSVMRHDGSGFLNRLAGALDGRGLPVSFTDGLPVVMSGALDVPNVSLKGTGRTPFDPRQVDLLARMYAGTRFEPLIAEGFDLRKTVADQAEALAKATDDVNGRTAEMLAANRNALSAKGFELEARRMAGLMRDNYNLGFIDVGGWDTHVNQGNAQGALANLLTNLGQGLAGFAEQMGPVWKQTVVVVLSEFGRTFKENGTRGTDHGHGTTYWVLGGGIRGGRILGEQVAVEPNTLNQHRDFPVLTEYRSLLAGLFRRLYQLDNARLQRVFPNASPLDVDLV